MRRILVIALALVTVSVFAGSASSTHGRNFWSGQWDTVTGALALQRVDDAAGRASLTARGGRPCAEPTDYFMGSYRTNAGDSGKVSGCTINQRRLVARWKTNYPTKNRNGTFDVTYASGRFSGRFVQDGGGSGPYTGTFKRHFTGDGANEGGRAAGEGTTYTYSFRGYANNVRVLSPLVGDWQLGIARIQGSGRFEVHEGKFVGNPGTVTINHDARLAKYSDRWLKAKVVGYRYVGVGEGHPKDDYFTLHVEITDSSHPEDECRIGLRGQVTLHDTVHKLSNGEIGDEITVGHWRGKCNTFQMGFHNTDAGPRTEPRYGGPPDGGQFAVVNLKITD